MSEYHDYGFTSDDMTHNLGYMLQPIVAMLNKDQNMAILDVGCGNGYLANYLISLGFNVYGTDASEAGIEIARKTNLDRFLVQDLSTDKLPAELQHIKFDTIISTEVIEHLYDPEAFLGFCKQALVNGGEFIITTPYHGYFKNLLLSIFNKWDTHINPLWLGGHIKMWSRTTLTKALQNAGFKVDSFIGCGRIPYLWKSMLIKATLH